MNKKFTLSAALALITFIGFAQCPYTFKRNNGNGTCGKQSEIRMYFSTCPSKVPMIDSVYANGVNTNVSASTPDTTGCAKNGYISYCFDGDLPTASSLQVFFDFDPMEPGNTICNVPDNPSAGPTPVLLSSFEVQRKNANTVNVTWKTDQEINSKSFEIQRSTGNSAFETVALIASKNPNSNIAQYYSFLDETNNLNQASLYRLKMIDIDNTFSFSPVKSVGGNFSKTDFTMFPNPGNGGTKITVANVNEPVNIMVFDNTGRMVRKELLTNSNSIQINKLPTGTYFVKVAAQGAASGSVKKLFIIN